MEEKIKILTDMMNHFWKSWKLYDFVNEAINKNPINETEINYYHTEIIKSITDIKHEKSEKKFLDNIKRYQTTSKKSEDNKRADEQSADELLNWL
jgi:hypothetical protein